MGRKKKTNNDENKKTTEKPIEKNKRYIVTITSEGEKGDGITKINDFVIITKKAQYNKTYEVQIIEIYSTYAFAKIIREIKKNTESEK